MSRSPTAAISAFGVLAGLLLLAPQAIGAQSARVDHVADGDTLQVELNGRERDVRLIGIDTPEVYGGVECGGRKASRSLKGMIGPGDRVRLVRDRTQDNRDFYGRLLRYVQFKGTDLGRRQLARGWAEVYVFDDPFKRVERYRRAEKRAKKRDRGIWSRCRG